LNHSWLHPNSGQRNTVVYVQDQYMADLHNAMGGYSPHGWHGYLYLNGLHWGMYYYHERPDHTWAAEMFGGEKEEYDCIKHNSSLVVNHSIGGNATSSYNSMVSAASAVASSPTNLARYNTLSNQLDVDNFITYLIVNWYGGNTDWPHKNWYATHRNAPGGLWRFHSWDAEHAIDKTINASDINNKFGASPSDIHNKLRNNPEYKLRFADIIHKHFFNNGAMTHPNTGNMYLARMTSVDRAIAGESARWGDNRRSYDPYTRSDWHDVQQDKLDHFFPERSDDTLVRLKGMGLYPNVAAPVFLVNGLAKFGGHISTSDSLTMTGAGTIYYTVDGNDPRLAGGGVNTAEVAAYSGAMTLGKSTRIKARAKSGSTWSALSDAVFAVGSVAENIRITEIMYHPPAMGDPEDPNKEFIELKNIGPDPVNLNLVAFTNGIDFTFADVEVGGGDQVVVVKKKSAFVSAHPEFSGVIAGEYAGSLDNGGERVEVQDALGQIIQSFKYKDGWRGLTDGRGFSLTIIDPTAKEVERTSQGLAAHWKMDDASGGTAQDSAGGNHGTLHGDASWTDGWIGGALSLDGSGDYVSIPTLAALEGKNMTAEAWIRLSGSAGTRNAIVMQHTPTNEGYRLSISSDKPTFSIIAHGRGATVSVVSPETIGREQWHHIAGTNDGAELKLYVDGELKGSAPSSVYSGVNYDAYIGYDHIYDTYFDGLLDDVRVYNRALNTDEFIGAGNSLERWGDEGSWRSSAYFGGSPGWDDSGIIPNPGEIVINEILAHSHSMASDWIELYNTTGWEIDIGGWYLSDSAADLKKYKIPANQKIHPGEHLVFYENTNFGESSGDPGRITGFAFSENGDSAYLSSAEGDMLTGYRAQEDFGASETGVSFGRYFKRSTGSYNFVSMEEPSPWLPNKYPKVGPVVISEVMYNPAWPVGGSYGNDSYEYVELHNITSGPVELWRADKALPWKFTKGMDFTFPDWPNVTTIPAGGHIVVVRDPNAFAELYPAVPAETVFGPYDGQLSNGGERLELRAT